MRQQSLKKGLGATWEKTLLLLCFFFLPTQLGKHFWAEFSFIYSLRIDYLSAAVYFWDVLVLCLLAVFFLRRPKLNLTALLLLFLFLLSQALSLLAASNIGAGLVRLEQLFITGIFGVYLASQRFGQIKGTLAWGMLGAVLLEGILAISQFILGGSAGLWLLGERSFSLSTPSIATFNWLGQVFLRPYATFPHPNVLSGFLVLVMPLLAALIPANRQLRPSLLIGSIAVILSFSRGSIFVWLIEVLIFLRSKLFILALLLILALPFLAVRFNSALNFDSLSLIRREELNLTAINLFLANPTTGVGLNNFINLLAASELVAGPSRFLQPVHNIFLLTLVETGWVGFLGFSLFLSAPLYKLWKGRQHPFLRLLMGQMMIILFLGLFDHYFLTLPQGQRLLFLFWALGMLEYSGEGN